MLVLVLHSYCQLLLKFLTWVSFVSDLENWHDGADCIFLTVIVHSSCNTGSSTLYGWVCIRCRSSGKSYQIFPHQRGDRASQGEISCAIILDYPLFIFPFLDSSYYWSDILLLYMFCHTMLFTYDQLTKYFFVLKLLRDTVVTRINLECVNR